MSMRLQVVMSDEEHAEIREAAERARTTVSAWVRAALRAARGDAAPADALVLRERGSRYAAGERATVEVDTRLLSRARERLGLTDAAEIVAHALRRAAVRPMTRAELLAAEGSGWAGDLDGVRGRQGPDPL